MYLSFITHYLCEQQIFIYKRGIIIPICRIALRITDNAFKTKHNNNKYFVPHIVLQSVESPGFKSRRLLSLYTLIANILCYEAKDGMQFDSCYYFYHMNDYWISHECTYFMKNIFISLRTGTLSCVFFSLLQYLCLHRKHFINIYWMKD